MARLFDEHIIRSVKTLNGTWKFKTDPDDIGISACWYQGLTDGIHLTVPSVWNTEHGLLTYSGAAWYQKEFYTEGGCLRLVFEAVMTEGTVWLDGQCLGNHYGGFTEFSFIVPNVSAGKHILTVRVDNRFDEKSIPQAKVDWYHYGGITRDVSVEQLSGISILSYRMEYTLKESLSEAAVTFRLTLYNAGDSDLSTSYRIKLGDHTVISQPVMLQSGETVTVHTPSTLIKDISLWDTKNPVLYPLEITTDSDDLLDRVGFRKVEIRHQQILLNGKPIELRGVNRHEDHPDWGFAFPQKLMKKDLDLAFDLGCNTIRGSHYPNAKAFLDMLDEHGMLFWSEIPIWGCGFSETALTDPDVIARGLTMHEEMVEQYYNHPSIIIWGMHNEIRTDTASAIPMSQCYYRFLKENGGNRIVTYASYKPMEDICFAYCDMISINLYYGWYYGKKESWDQFAEQFRHRRNALGYENKPVVVSEFGAAALYGNHTFDNVPWSEEYQAELLEHCIALFHRDPMFQGCYVWQFCDIRTAEEVGLNRARGFNNKGILNEYRKPKTAYFTVRKAFRRIEENPKK